jgi:hypothetical protein
MDHPDLSAERHCSRLGGNMYCEEDKVAALLLALHKMKPAARHRKVAEFLGLVEQSRSH